MPSRIIDPRRGEPILFIRRRSGPARVVGTADKAHVSLLMLLILSYSVSVGALSDALKKFHL